jgi:hypothetical protein
VVHLVKAAGAARDKPEVAAAGVGAVVVAAQAVQAAEVEAGASDYWPSMLLYSSIIAISSRAMPEMAGLESQDNIDKMWEALQELVTLPAAVVDEADLVAAAEPAGAAPAGFPWVFFLKGPHQRRS